MPVHIIPSTEMQYHQQQAQYQNSQMPFQGQSSSQQVHPFDQGHPDNAEYQKAAGLKRRFSEVEGTSVSYTYNIFFSKLL